MWKKCVIVIVILFGFGDAYSFEIGDIEIHGFASTGYMKSDANNFLLPSEEGSFEFNEAGISFATSLTDDIRIGLQFYSYDLGDTGDNQVKLDWAFIDYQWKEFLGIRLGKIKTPYGLYNEVQDYDMLRTSILLPSSIYHKYHRETVISIQGGEFYGNIPMGIAGSLGYDLFIGTMNIESDGGVAKLSSRDGTRYKSSRFDYAGGGRLKWNTPLDGLLIGATLFKFDVTYELESQAAPVRITSSAPNSTVSIFSAEYNWRDLTLAGEYHQINGTNEIAQDMSALGMPNPPPMEQDMNIEAWYGLISYRFTDWFEAGTYYSVYYPDKNDKNGDNLVLQGKPDYAAWQKDWAVSTRFDITDFWLIKLEVHFMDGVAQCVELDNPDGYEDQNWTLFAIKTTFSF